MSENKLFIIWDPRDGKPHASDGNIISDGLIGRVGLGNPYIIGYPGYPDNESPDSLAVGERIVGVRYTLSGSIGIYDVYRVG